MAWLDPEIVAAWLRLNLPGPVLDDDELVRVCEQTEIYVQRCRPDMFDDADPPVYDPDSEVLQGAVMYASREYRRRNSPSGSEQFADGSQAYVSKYDSDIERALRTGAFNRPGVG